MLSKFHDVNYVDAQKFTHIAMPLWDSSINLESSAVKVMTDFRLQPASFIRHDMPVDEVRSLMERAHINLMFVVKDSAYQGLITLRYLQSRKVMVKLQELGVERNEFTAEHIMLPKERTHALCYDSVKEARIGDVLHTLQSLGESYVIVVAADDNDADIVGVISAVEVAKYLNIPRETFHSDKTFLSLVQELKRHSIE